MNEPPNEGQLPKSGPLRAVAGVIERKGVYLIGQRLPDDRLGGYWEFPGGKLEADESLFECIEREISEELKCQITARELFDTSVSLQKQKLIELHAIECEIKSQEPKINGVDHDLLCWITPSNMQKLSFASADIPFVKKLQINET